jgi:divalent metal cation (Fe/Co/Zn/Cd) transporter
MSVAAAIATIGLKTLAWWLTGSVGLLSDALESIVNLAAALLALTMLRLAASPPSEEHPYGFSKAEYFAAGIEGALIVLAAAGIFATAIPRLLRPEPLEAPLLGLGISAAASLINLGAAIVLLRVGKRHQSITLEADGRHLMTDCLDLRGRDPRRCAGVPDRVAAPRTRWWRSPVALPHHLDRVGLVRRSAGRACSDAAIPQEDRDAIQKLFDEYAKQGVTFHAFRTRRAAARRFVSFHLLVPTAGACRARTACRKKSRRASASRCRMPPCSRTSSRSRTPRPTRTRGSIGS